MTQTETIHNNTMREALDAIHEEASRILNLVPDDAQEISNSIQLIISIARYQQDIRSQAEIGNR